MGEIWQRRAENDSKTTFPRVSCPGASLSPPLHLSASPLLRLGVSAPLACTIAKQTTLNRHQSNEIHTSDRINTRERIYIYIYISLSIYLYLYIFIFIYKPQVECARKQNKKRKMVINKNKQLDICSRAAQVYNNNNTGFHGRPLNRTN